MGTINVNFDFGAFYARERAAALHGAHARKWMASQTTNVLQEARDPNTSQARLEELALNGTAPVRQAVAANRSASPTTLFLLSERDFITSVLSQRLSRNPVTPREALVNIRNSTFARWFGNWDRVEAHPNWDKN